jgi:hypothetical protein
MSCHRHVRADWFVEELNCALYDKEQARAVPEDSLCVELLAGIEWILSDLWPKIGNYRSLSTSR